MAHDHNGSGNTLDVTDQYLQDMAKKLDTFLQAWDGDHWIAHLNDWSYGKGGSASPGDYSYLRPGAPGILASADLLRGNFQQLCKDLLTAFTAFKTQMHLASDKLGMVQSTLQNGADEALSAAQMLQIVDALTGWGGSDPGSKSPPPPGDTSPPPPASK